MIIQHNLPAMNALRNLGIQQSAVAKSLERLSSGMRINRAADDPAGLAISEKMRAQIRGLSMAEMNVMHSISLLQTAEGGLNETHAILQRMRELAVQSANGTYKDEVDRENLQKEIVALKQELDRIASSTNYNGIKLLNGTMGGKSGKLDGTNVMFGEDGLTVHVLPAVGENLSVTDIELLKEYGGKNTPITISTKIFDGDAVTTVQIGDRSFTTRITDNGGTNSGTLYDANGNSVGSITPGTKTAVVSGLRLTSSGEVDTGQVEDGAMYATDSSEHIFQIGANGSADQRIGTYIGNTSSGSLGGRDGVIADISVATQDGAKDAIKVIDSAINMVSSQRASIGAQINRLEHTLNNLGVQKENLQAAEASIRDADMAQEMMEFTKRNILMQAAQAMLAQAMQLPQGILQLLR